MVKSVKFNEGLCMKLLSWFGRMFLALIVAALCAVFVGYVFVLLGVEKPNVLVYLVIILIAGKIARTVFQSFPERLRW